MALLAAYFLLMTFALNGLVLVGIINERQRKARIVRELWRIRGRR